jgi:hypothetical protein
MMRGYFDYTWEAVPVLRDNGIAEQPANLTTLPHRLAATSVEFVQQHAVEDAK